MRKQLQTHYWFWYKNYEFEDFLEKRKKKKFNNCFRPTDTKKG